MEQMQHELILRDRTHLTLSGVTAVTGFDDRTVLLYTALGTLTVLGRGLTVGELNLASGALEISGEVTALRYGDRDRTRPRGLLGRLLR